MNPCSASTFDGVTLKKIVLLIIALASCVSAYVFCAESEPAEAAEEQEPTYTIVSETDTVMVNVSQITDTMARSNDVSDITLQVIVGDCSVFFDSEALYSLTDSELTVSELEDNVKRSMYGNIGDRQIYHIDFGPNKDLGEGKATVTVPCTLKSWWEPENIEVRYLDGDGYTVIPCMYSDGYVTFETGHFSDYALFYVDSDIARAASTVALLFATVIVLVSVIVAFIYNRER